MAAAPDAGRPGPRAPGGFVAVAALAGLALAGHFSVHTFVAVLLAPTGAAVPGGVSGLLLLFGVVSAVAVLQVGRVRAERTSAALVAAAASVAVALAAMHGLGLHPAADVTLVVAWAATTAVVPVLGQTVIMRLGGAARRTVAGAVVPVTFNLGIAVGAGIGSGVVDRVGPGGLPAAGATLAAAAAVGLLAVHRRLDRVAPPSS